VDVANGSLFKNLKLCGELASGCAMVVLKPVRPLLISGQLGEVKNLPLLKPLNLSLILTNI